MASWYGILWKHVDRHPERLRAAERERLVNAVEAHQRSPRKRSIPTLIALAIAAGFALLLRVASSLPSSLDR